MLTQLHIENFALIQNVTLEFSPQLNVFTGETGAGKSVLIDAIRFISGERMETDRMNSSGGTCVVEAAFEIEDVRLKRHPAVEAFLNQGEESLILRREYSAEGRSRAWINNRLVNLGNLKELGNLLIDIHGQYDHQLLLDAGSHIELLDRFGGDDRVLEQYRSLHEEYSLLVRRREELRALESGRERELDLLKYQVEEIENAEPEEGEDEALKTERIRLINAEKLHEGASRLLDALDEGEMAVSSVLAQSGRDLAELANLDNSVGAVRQDYETAQLTLEEVIRFLRDYREGLSFDSDRLNEIDKRLDVLDLLKRKYGKSIPEILGFLKEAREKYDRLDNSGVYEKELDAKIEKLLPSLRELAGTLSEKRKKTALALKRIIETELKDLNIPNAQFGCVIEESDFSPAGRDRIEFTVSLNAGQPKMPLRKIISAGEVSRVMLAMKKALMKVDPVPTLIFDEIDSNIGGRLGTVTGGELKEIAETRQVLLITHLPQIASFADRHFKVAKAVRQGKTVAEYEVVDGDARVRELAQMMSGKRESEISKKHAEEMLERVGEIRDSGKKR